MVLETQADDDGECLLYCRYYLFVCFAKLGFELGLALLLTIALVLL